MIRTWCFTLREFFAHAWKRLRVQKVSCFIANDLVHTVLMASWCDLPCTSLTWYHMVSRVEYFIWVFSEYFQFYLAYFPDKVFLVGGLEHEFYFSIYWECHHLNWLICFRGFEITSQIYVLFLYNVLVSPKSWLRLKGASCFPGVHILVATQMSLHHGMVFFREHPGKDSWDCEIRSVSDWFFSFLYQISCQRPCQTPWNVIRYHEI